MNSFKNTVIFSFIICHQLLMPSAPASPEINALKKQPKLFALHDIPLISLNLAKKLMGIAKESTPQHLRQFHDKQQLQAFMQKAFNAEQDAMYHLGRILQLEEQLEIASDQRKTHKLQKKYNNTFVLQNKALETIKTLTHEAAYTPSKSHALNFVKDTLLFYRTTQAILYQAEQNDAQFKWQETQAALHETQTMCDEAFESLTIKESQIKALSDENKKLKEELEQYQPGS